MVTIIDDLTWTSLGGAANNTLGFAVLLREITSDALSVPIAYFQFTSNLTTNGSDVLVNMDGVDGQVRWTV